MYSRTTPLGECLGDGAPRVKGKFREGVTIEVDGEDCGVAGASPAPRRLGGGGEGGGSGEGGGRVEVTCEGEAGAAGDGATSLRKLCSPSPPPPLLLPSPPPPPPPPLLLLLLPCAVLLARLLQCDATILSPSLAQ